MISQEMLKISILDTSLKITDLRLQPQLPGTNELMPFLFIQLISPQEMCLLSEIKNFETHQR